MKQSYSFKQCLRGVLAVSLVTLLAAATNAQEKKSWDFSKGLSEETIANLNADSRWASNGTDATTGETNNWKNNGANMSGDLTANGVVIPETKGLNFATSGQKKGNDIHLATTKMRLTRKDMKFTLPKLVGGQTVTIVAQSANSTATNRGFNFGDNMEWVSGPVDGICLGAEGRQELVWKVKESVTDSTEITITLSPDGGLDIFLIMIDQGDGPDLEVAKKTAYIGSEDDFAYSFFAGAPDRLEVTAINPDDSHVTLDSLQTYQALVVSPALAADAKIVPVLKSAIAYQPMLNLNTAIYEAWGLGKAAASAEAAYTLAPAFAEDETFVSLAEGNSILFEGSLSAIELGSYFAADDTIASLGENIVGIHRHNPGRNSYIGVPVSPDAMLNPEVTFMIDAVSYLASTKKDVTATSTPSISQKHSHLATEVTISAASNATVYYTLDGTQPTVESALYEAPFVLTEAKTVNAFAVADGYNDSKTATLDVIIKSQAATPKITMTQDETSTTVELSTASEGVELYYSYHPFTEVSKAQKYTAPIVLSQEPSPIYALAAGGDFVDSEMAEDYVAIKSLNANTIRMDTVAHFNADQEHWLIDNSAEGGTGNASAYYYWNNKKAWNYFSTDVDHTETVKGSDGQDSVITYYKPNPEAKKVVTSATDTDWRLVSSGQILISQNVAALDYVGNGAAAYAAETAEDMIGGIPTKFDIQFAGKIAGDPYTGAIESTKKFTAPFDVVTYIASGNKNANTTMELQISADGETWEKVGNLNISDQQRYYKKSRVGVEKAGEWFVRLAHTAGTEKAMVFDIYILNNGEISKDYVAGIEDITTGSAEVLSVEIYDLNGIRLAQPATGVNIVRTVYTDGTVKTEKVLNR